jgi:hypothetical protein
MQSWHARIAQVLGAVLLFVGLAGFFLAPILGLFDVNALHNVVHVATGIILLIVGFSARGKHAKLGMILLGLVYAVVAVLGFAAPAFMQQLLAISAPDNWLHVALAVGLLGASLGIGHSD